MLALAGFWQRLPQNGPVTTQHTITTPHPVSELRRARLAQSGPFKKCPGDYTAYRYYTTYHYYTTRRWRCFRSTAEFTERLQRQ